MQTRQGSETRIRYVVVGGGWISQAAFMPGVAQTGNSELTALVTGDPEKAKELGGRYGLKTFAYEEYGWALESGLFDAVYLALPNGMHHDFAMPALKAGIHVLLEKPMATSVAECEAIVAAAQGAGAKLMIAYRLHCEPGTLDAIARVRRGEIGAPLVFSSVFGQQVSPKNHRAHQGYWAGPVPDMGTYPLNAARNLFGDEPIAVDAHGTRRPDSPFDFDETVTVVLRFSGGRIAQFTVSYASDAVDEYRIVGTKGDLQMSPGFMFGIGLKGRLTVGGQTQDLRFPSVDQFGGQTRYFSDCILNDRIPEPDGEEGLADVRVLAAVERALESGKTQELPPMQRRTRPSASQAVELPEIAVPEMVNAAKPGG